MEEIVFTTYDNQYLLNKTIQDFTRLNSLNSDLTTMGGHLTAPPLLTILGDSRVERISGNSSQVLRLEAPDSDAMPGSHGCSQSCGLRH